MSIVQKGTSIAHEAQIFPYSHPYFSTIALLCIAKSASSILNRFPLLNRHFSAHTLAALAGSLLVTLVVKWLPRWLRSCCPPFLLCSRCAAWWAPPCAWVSESSASKKMCPHTPPTPWNSACETVSIRLIARFTTCTLTRAVARVLFLDNSRKWVYIWIHDGRNLGHVSFIIDGFYIFRAGLQIESFISFTSTITAFPQQISLLSIKRIGHWTMNCENFSRYLIIFCQQYLLANSKSSMFVKALIVTLAIW